MIQTLELDLKEALTGWKRTVTTIDGKQLNLEKDWPNATWKLRFVPRPRHANLEEAGYKGNFVVKYNVKFPTTLTAVQKQKLREIL